MTVYVPDAAAVGVPVISPVDVFKLNPAGRAGEILHESGDVAVPNVATTPWL